MFLAQGAALVIYPLVNVAAMAGGAWFGSIGWPRVQHGEFVARCT
jgi:hypothetical protein